MKRSELNQIMRNAVTFMAAMNFKLPPFAYFSIDEWKQLGPEYDEIKENMLGWDITDFGSGDFKKIGLLMFTIRNGNFRYKEKYVKPYAEKLLIVDEEQITPFHYHWSKMEDIINRGGGNLLVQIYNKTQNDQFADTPVKISIDGRNYFGKPGEIVQIKPGESISLPNGQYHKFWGEKGTGMILIGEVSTVNDDNVDNRFHENIGRFPKIEEDVKPLYLLYKDYPVFLA